MFYFENNRNKIPKHNKSDMREKNPNRFFELLFIFSEVIIMILYGLCTEYGEFVNPEALDDNSAKSTQAKDNV